jgi:hypothetical protein
MQTSTEVHQTESMFLVSLNSNYDLILNFVYFFPRCARF